MLKKGVTVLALGVIAAGLTAPARAGDPHEYPPAEARVPNAGYAVIGDGDPTAEPFAAYRNLESGSSEDNLVALDDVPAYVYLIPDKGSRQVRLRVSSRADGAPMDPIQYDCQGGAYGLTGSNAFLQCYSAAESDGYYVDFPPFPKKIDPERLYGPCVSHTWWYEDDGTLHITADGSGCVAHLYDREGKGRTTLVTDANGDPILFNVPVWAHAHYLPSS